MIFDKNGLQIKLDILYPNTQTVSLTAIFMNITPVPFKDVVFQVSVPKSLTLKMDLISGTVLAPFNQEQLTQKMTLSNPNQVYLFLFLLEYFLKCIRNCCVCVLKIK